MSTEVGHTSGHTQTTVANPSPTTSSSGPKTSMFAKKAGFVIPKNKLSGSLVPVFRGTKRGDADSIKEEATNQVHRKTKWGADLSVDTTVRKGRALAYQTRINQISQQLTSGTLVIEDDQDTISTSEFHYGKTSDHQLSSEESELLQLERRETIGEILKLNPTYKAPADYKPLLKEAKVPIPETGAKIRVYGTKSDTGMKVEVTPANGKEIDNTYEDLYVHVSADTFEKIDAAVALIELLVTPVSVNPVSTSTTTTVSDDNLDTRLSQSMPSSTIAPPLINQGTGQPYPRSLPPPQGQFQPYPQSWFSPESGLVTPANPSAPLLNNSNQVSSSPFNHSNPPPLFGPRPVITPSFTPLLQNPSIFPLGQTGGPRFTQMPLQSHFSPAGPHHNTRPAISTSPQSRLVNSPNNMISPLSGSAQSQPSMPQVPMCGPSPNILPGPAPMLPQPGNPNSFSNFDSIRPISGAIPRPQPSSSDFTFQPHRPPNAASSQVTWQSSQPTRHNITPPIQTGQAPLTPQSPFTRPVVHNMNPSPVQSFPRPQQINQPRPPILSNFAGNPMVPLVPHRHPALPGQNAHIQPRNFIPPHTINNGLGPFHPGPGNQMHIQQNHPQGPQRFPPPRQQHFGNHPGRPFSSSSGRQQVYDPFSPTSVPFNPQMGGNAPKLHGESDPEYEDLMASVGVK
ncbi:hypothetical protein BUALT_Bualt02G0012000 [Buddleja alternifolia]|uniref:Splicing factor 1 n=1 Tax=Buddleja alternifolia TaxID=168488 RepID=A0AAV6Y4Z9_9LAMI|nr:hypothetical protein BUALT_Bualt02G0012000 [Buddleja alternifolia]